MCRNWFAAVALGVAAATAAAQDYPAKAVRIIVPFATGGPADVYARFLGQRLQTALGQPFVVENKPGAGAITGTQEAAQAAADGYTLLMMSNTHTVNETLIANRPYQLMRDFVPVAPVNYSDLLLVVHPSVSASAVTDLLAAAKARPGQMNYASSGNGTPYHMAGELFKSMAGVNIVHVPYKGSSGARTDVMAGHVQMMFDAVTAMAPQVKAGKVKALGVTSKTRIPALPDVAPIADVVPGYESAAYFGLLGPANLPRDVLARLHASAAKAAQSPELKSRLEPDGSRVVGGTPEEFRAFLVADVEKWRQVVKATGAKAE